MNAPDRYLLRSGNKKFMVQTMRVAACGHAYCQWTKLEINICAHLQRRTKVEILTFLRWTAVSK